MNASDLLLRWMREAARYARSLADVMLAIPDRRGATAAVKSRALLSRKPTRGTVAELADLVAVSPIIFGLSVVVAMPLPQRMASPAPRQSVYGGLASLAMPSAAAGPELGGRVAKSANRASAKEAGSPPNTPYFPGPSPDDSPEFGPRRIDGESAHVAVAEDGRLIVDGQKFRLAGIVMPKAETVCRRLDGVEVRCIDRVVARLTILMQQHGVLSCSPILDASGERSARCLAGKTDLADDLVQTRLARKS